MISGLIDLIANRLVSLNSDWLSEVRHTGYLNRKPEGDLIVTDGKDEIGITDRNGNSGYIRFGRDESMSTAQLSTTSSCNKDYGYSWALRLVIIVKSELPEDLLFQLSQQMMSLTFPEPYSNMNTKVRATGGGSNTYSIVLQESGKQDLNNQYRALYIDFNASFDWRQRCEYENLPIMNQPCGCETVLELPCVQHCDVIKVGMPASYTGSMFLKTAFNGFTVTQVFDVVDGEEIEIPTENLNADYLYTIQLLDEDEEPVTIQNGEVSPRDSYDCIQVKVNP